MADWEKSGAHGHNTKLTKQEREAYERFLSKRQQEDTWDYDPAAAFLRGDKTAANGHGSDIGKKPNHPTFSDQSKWHSINNPGGKWGDGTFTPSRKMWKDPGRMEALIKYLRGPAENDKVRLMIPNQYGDV